MKIRKNIFVPMISLAIISSVAVLLFSIFLYNRDMSRALDEKINVASMSVYNEMNELKTRSLMAILGLKDSKYMEAGLLTGDPHVVAEMVRTQLPTIAQIGYCVIVDKDGVALHRTHDPTNFGDNISDQPHFAAALNGHVTTSFTRGPIIRLGITSASPVYDKEGNLIGAVAFGYRLDQQDVSMRIKEITGCEVTFFMDDERVSTTILDVDKTYAIGTKLDPAISEIVRRGDVFTGRTTVLGHELLTRYSPLRGFSGEIIGMVFVGVSTEENDARLRYFMFNGMLITIAIILISILFATRITAIVERRLMYTTELIAARDAAEQSNHLKSIFLANMSHEIRTPMNAILGIAEIQLQRDIMSNISREAFEQICDSGNLLINIINDILDFSKIEAGKLEIVTAQYDIPSLINDSVQIVNLRYESKAIKFVLKVDENTPLELVGDGFRIRQILNNLLTNAVKYTDEGEVCLSVWAEPGKDDGTTVLVFRVSDTGQGMSEEQVDQLFEEYSRFNLETNRSIDGTGLGMHITKRLLDMMDGDIVVESEPNKGSTFTVWIPQKIVGTAVCGPELAQRLQSFRFQGISISKRARIVHEYMPYGNVLVVDDIESNLYVAAGLLLPYRLKIDTAKSGYEAIDKIEAGQIYDLIFMDHMMPQLDGVKTVKILRDMGYQHPIVALTANAVSGQEEMFLANGFDGFVPKPIDSRDLNHYLIKFIRNKQPEDVLEAARKEQQNVAVIEESAEISLEIIKHFIIDARNTIQVVEETYMNCHDLSNEALESFIVAVHGLKSALNNIGEITLADIAFELEAAGKERNIVAIAEICPDFIMSVNELIKKIKPAEADADIHLTSADTAYLREKLMEINILSLSLKKAGIRTIIDDLRSKPMPAHILDILDEISSQVLHSNFKKAAAIAEEAADGLAK